MSIIKNSGGDEFLEFFEVAEEELTNPNLYVPLTHALMVVKSQNDYLLVFNAYKKKWEVPGGMIDEGESPRDCVIRELKEETNQTAQAVSFEGVMKFSLKSGTVIEYGALYSGSLPAREPFKENDEVTTITYWDLKTNIGYIDEIDEYLIRMVGGAANGKAKPS